MLTDDEHKTLEQEIARYPSPKAAGIDCLVKLQESRGWLSDETLADLAPLLGMSVHELEGIATFYNRLHRKPVGRHIIAYCDSVSCWIMGSDQIREALQEQLEITPGETTPDQRFTLIPAQCLGNCERAPALAVNDEPYCELSPEGLDDILSRYV